MKKKISPISKYRQAKSMTLEAFGDMFKVNKSTVLRWECGRRIPAERAVQIERVAGIPRYDLRPDIFQKAAQ